MQHLFQSGVERQKLEEKYYKKIKEKEHHQPLSNGNSQL
jgi:hypothetical protein